MRTQNHRNLSFSGQATTTTSQGCGVERRVGYVYLRSTGMVKASWEFKPYPNLNKVNSWFLSGKMKLRLLVGLVREKFGYTQI